MRSILGREPARRKGVRLVDFPGSRSCIDDEQLPRTNRSCFGDLFVELKPHASPDNGEIEIGMPG
jgi:hypothetical protein